MEPYVLYKENGNYKFTNSDNYNARVQDANRICTFSKEEGFENAQEVLDYICKYSTYVTPESVKVLAEGIGEPDMTELRFTGLTDQIDVLAGMAHENGSLSSTQQDQVADLREQVRCYGERGEPWVKVCDDLINGGVGLLESMMTKYTIFIESIGCPDYLADAALDAFKAVLVEASQSSDVAEPLRSKVGRNPNETQGIGVFGLGGDDNLPERVTIDNQIADSMAAGTFDSLGDNITTASPNDFDETMMGIGDSLTDTSGNDLHPEDWNQSGESTPADPVVQTDSDTTVVDSQPLEETPGESSPPAEEPVADSVAEPNSDELTI